MLLQLRLLELLLLVLRAGLPELLELLHGDRLRGIGQVLLEIGDGVLRLGQDIPLWVGVLLEDSLNQ